MLFDCFIGFSTYVGVLLCTLRVCFSGDFVIDRYTVESARK